MLFDLLGSGNPALGILTFLIVFAVLVFCISVHEFAHAYAANRLGDPTPKALGRLTLNPMAHLDPLGTLLLVVAGFGWGKPVPFNPNYLQNPRRGSAIISLAGPLTNFSFAVLFALVYKVMPVGIVSEVLTLVVYLNLVLGFFNLIPVHPLDGFKVVWGLLPYQLSIQWMDLAPYGIYFLLILIFTNLTDILVRTPVSYFAKLLL